MERRGIVLPATASAAEVVAAVAADREASAAVPSAPPKHLLDSDSDEEEDGVPRTAGAPQPREPGPEVQQRRPATGEGGHDAEGWLDDGLDEAGAGRNHEQDVAAAGPAAAPWVRHEEGADAAEGQGEGESGFVCM